MDVREPRAADLRLAGAPAPATIGTRPDPDADRLDEWFTYCAPRSDQAERYEEIRASARALAETIIRCCPVSADRTTALRSVRQAVMWGNSSIACGGR